MANESVAFIGGGNMAMAIAGGMLQGGFSATDIIVAEPSVGQQAILEESLPGISITDDNDAAVSSVDLVILSVKPQIIAGVCRRLADAVLARRPLIISIAAGTRIADIDDWLGGGNAVVRVMPNQPALLRMGVSGLFANASTSPQQLESAIRIMSAVGEVVNVSSESDIDAVTAVSGSGPAYFYLLIDMMIKTGVRLGLEETAARTLAIETALGATTLVKSSADSMDELIARVRSPGGTTAAALDSLLNNRVRDIFDNALTEARDRASELANISHDDAAKESQVQ